MVLIKAVLFPSREVLPHWTWN